MFTDRKTIVKKRNSEFSHTFITVLFKIWDINTANTYKLFLKFRLWCKIPKLDNNPKLAEEYSWRTSISQAQDLSQKQL